MTKISISAWNINSRSKEGVYPEFLSESIPDSDIVVLSEVKNSSHFDEFCTKVEGYQFVSTNNIIGNDIAIAFKKGLEYKVFPNPKGNDLPNMLHVAFQINNKLINLFAVRVRISDGSIQDYKERFKQVKEFSRYMAQFENNLCVGDFNTSFIRGKMSDSLQTVSQLYEGKLTAHYNYHILKDYIERLDWSVYTPVDSYSWGLSLNNDDTIQYGYIKNDHLICSNKLFNNVEVAYDWSFVEDNLDSYLPQIKLKNIKPGYPDHAILNATLYI